MSAQLDLFSNPLARNSDPITAHEAANGIKPGNAELIMAIRRYAFLYGASTAFQIAESLSASGRWQEDTVRTAVSRSGLTKWPGGITPGGRPCSLYGTAGVNVETHGRV